MKILFVKSSLSWPRSSGHDVHCYHMMQALGHRGHEISLATVAEANAGALHDVALTRYYQLGETIANGVSLAKLSATWLQQRFRSYWGIDESLVRSVALAADDCRADTVVAVGLDVLPYLLGVAGRQRVWYAADEWVWHHLSLCRPGRAGSWEHAKQALIKGLYERAFAPILDRVWVVSEADRRAMQYVAGMRTIDVVPNGVDGDHYQPVNATEIEQSCTFWGRLDFGPNIQALEWFCTRVWAHIRRECPHARFTIYGFHPTAAVRALTGRDGINVVPDLPDLRVEVGRHQVVVLPFVSGGGIKNKLLEAAGMARPIICSRRACGGLRAGGSLPMIKAGNASEWTQALVTLWHDEPRRRALGADARRWVIQHHSWDTAARAAETALEQTFAGRHQ